MKYEVPANSWGESRKAIDLVHLGRWEPKVIVPAICAPPNASEARGCFFCDDQAVAAFYS